MPDEVMEASIRELAAWRASTASPCSVLCRAPFAQLHFMPDGNVAVCSKSTKRWLGNVAEHRILDLWRSPATQSIRAELAQNRFPAGCELCAEHMRRENVRNNPLLDFDRVDVSHDGQWPVRLSIAFSDLCNLGCRHCSPDLSSVLRTRAGLPSHPRVYGDAFFAQLAELMPHVRDISLLGGEPFLHEEMFRLCELLLARGAPHPNLHVTTNGTVWNARLARLAAVLPMQIAVSIDAATAATFERLRVGARFDRVMANVQQIAATQRAHGRQLRFNFCLMRNNWQEYADVLLLAERWRANLWVSFVTSPERMSLFTLGAAAKQRVLAALQQRTPELQSIDASNLVKWHEALRTLGASPSSPLTAHRVLTMADRGHLHLAARVADRIAKGAAEAREEIQLRQLQLARQSGDAAAMTPVAAADRPLPSMRMAWWLKDHGYHELSVLAARRVAASAPDHAESLLLRAEVHLDAGELAVAEELLAALQEREQPPLGTWLRLAWLRYHQSRTDEGLAAAAELERRLAAAEERPPWLVAGLLAVRSNLFRQAARPSEAIADLEQLVQLEPANPQHVEFLDLVRREAATAAAR